MMNPGADFNNFCSYGVKLCLCEFSTLEKLTAEMVHQNIGHAVQEETKLIGLKTGAGGSV